MLSILFVISISGNIVTADQWDTFHHDNHRTGYTSNPGPETDNLLWSYTTEGSILYAPAVIDNNVYFGLQNGDVYCLNAKTGALLWDTTIGPLGTCPVVDNNKLYIGSVDDNLYCLDANTGTILWNYTTDDYVQSSPAATTEYVYFGSYDKNLYCLYKNNGTLKWRYTTVGRITTSAPALDDEQVYIISQNGSTDIGYALDAETGAHNWDFTLSGNNYGKMSPLLINNNVYLSLGGVVYCLDTATTEVLYTWISPVLTSMGTSPITDTEHIYKLTGNGLYCFNAETGQDIWNIPIPNYAERSPAIAVDTLYHYARSSPPNFFVQSRSTQDGSLNWEYEMDGNYGGPPVIADGKLFASSQYTLYCFQDETPPDLPLTITAPSSADETTSITITITSNSQPIADARISVFGELYQTDTNGQITVTAPEVLSDTEYTITSSKNGYIPSTATITIKNVEESPDENPVLLITTSTTVPENTEFTITVTAEGNPVSDVIIAFNEQIYLTNSQGKTTVSAPIVTQDTEYILSASKTGYQASTSTITILNSQPEGITGVARDNTNTPLKDVIICVYLIEQQQSVTTYCELTDAAGTYTIDVPAGTYKIKAQKEGYTSDIKENIQVPSQSTITVNFTLTKTTSQTKSLIEYTIQQEIQKGRITATIDLTPAQKDIAIYNQQVNVELLSSDTQKERIQIGISGKGTNGSKLVVYLGILSNPDELTVEYDNQQIPQASDILSFFDETNTNNEWILTSTEQNDNTHYILIINIPHFSEHTITINLYEFIQPITIITYLLISTMFILIAIIPILYVERKRG